MSWLARSYRTVSLGTLLEEPKNKSFRVAVTFDDGYASLRDEALPILRELGVPATVYLTSGCIKDTRIESRPEVGHYPDETFLAWEDVDKLLAADWTIGSHGVDHVDLANCALKEAAQQLRRSKELIEHRTGLPCRHFAYPWGRSTAAVRAAVAEAGYRYAAGAYHAPLRANFDAFAFPRINIARDYTLNDFKAIVRGDWNYLGFLHRARGQ